MGELNKVRKLNKQVKNLNPKGADNFSTVDTLVLKNVASWREDNQEDNHDAEEDEGDGTEGDIIKVTFSKCP